MRNRAALAAAAILSVVFTTAATAGERVTIPSAGGVTIVGEFTDGGMGAPGVLLFPMCGAGYMAGWEPVATKLQSLGVSSLAVHYQGYGGSSGLPPERRGNIGSAAKFWTETWGPDADASLTWLRTRVGAGAPVALAGASCGVHMALLTASRHASVVKGVVALAGPHADEHREFVTRTPSLPVFAASAEGDRPFVDSIRAVHAASGHPKKELVLLPGSQHGTQLFAANPALVERIAAWLDARLEGR